MIFMPLPFHVDVYTMTVTRNAAGQQVKSWSFNRQIKVNYMPARNEERLVGKVENPESFTFWTDDLNVDEKNEIRNLHDRYGAVIEEGPLNVIGVKKFRGFSAMNHSMVRTRKKLD